MSPPLRVRVRTVTVRTSLASIEGTARWAGCLRFVFKMMKFVLKMIEFVLKMNDFVLKMKNFVLQMMNFVSKMMIYVQVAGMIVGAVLCCCCCLWCMNNAGGIMDDDGADCDCCGDCGLFASTKRARHGQFSREES